MSTPPPAYPLSGRLRARAGERPRWCEVPEPPGNFMQEIPRYAELLHAWLGFRHHICMSRIRVNGLAPWGPAHTA
jgi:hypothetical protein